jgi:hypothetical protein
MKKHQITAFYLETLLLIAVFVAVILVLTQLFGAARAQSSGAKTLTNAVILAENAAESAAAAENPEELASLLNRNGNARVAGGVVEAGYDRNMVPDGGSDPELRVTVTWEPAADTPDFVESEIVVYASGGEPVYTLKTAVMRGEPRMKQTPVRLGPLALLLNVISICLTVLAILSFSTARGICGWQKSTRPPYRIATPWCTRG